MRSRETMNDARGPLPGRGGVMVAAAEDWVTLVCPLGAQDGKILHGDRCFEPYREDIENPRSRWLVKVPRGDVSFHLDGELSSRPFGAARDDPRQSGEPRGSCAPSAVHVPWTAPRGSAARALPPVRAKPCRRGCGSVMEPVAAPSA